MVERDDQGPSEGRSETIMGGWIPRQVERDDEGRSEREPASGTTHAPTPARPWSESPPPPARARSIACAHPLRLRAPAIARSPAPVTRDASQVSRIRQSGRPVGTDRRAQGRRSGSVRAVAGTRLACGVGIPSKVLRHQHVAVRMARFVPDLRGRARVGQTGNFPFPLSHLPDVFRFSHIRARGAGPDRARVWGVAGAHGVLGRMAGGSRDEVEG